MASGVNFGLQQYSQFDPRTIPTCALWLDASDRLSFSPSLTVGTTITQWNDKSGNNHNAVKQTGSPRPGTIAGDQGRLTVYFDGSSAFKSTLSVGSTTPVTVFVVAASDAPPNTSFRTALSLNSYSGARGSMLNVYEGTNDNWWFSGGTTGTDGTTSTVTFTRRRWYIVANYWSASSTQINIDGTAYTASSSAPSSLQASATCLVGATVTSASSTTLSEFWNGFIAEVIVYTTTLRASERRQVEGYLAWKWGRQTNLPTSHPYRYFPLVMRPFQPVDVGSCAIWVDPADGSSMLALSGTQPTSVQSKGHQAITLDNAQPVNNLGPGSPWTAWPPPGVTNYGTQFVTGSGLNTLQFTRTVGSGGVYGNGYNGSYLRVPAVTFTSQQRTMFFVLATEATGLDEYAHIFSPTVWQGTGNVHQRGLLIRPATTFVMVPVTGFGVQELAVQASGAPAMTDGTAYLFALRHTTSTATNYTSINGTPSTVTNQALTTGYATGTSEYALGIFFAYTRQIRMGDFLLYDGALQDFEVRQVEGYLAWKWGKKASLPTTHPYYTFPPATPLFVPTLFANCALWLDAADASTFTLSSTSVTAWADKSGNGRNATGGTSPTLSGSGVVFNGTSQYLTTPYTALPTAETVFVVGTITGTTNNRNYVLMGSSAVNGRGYIVQRTTGGVYEARWDKYGIASYAPTTGITVSTQFLSTGVYTGSASTSVNGGAQNTPVTATFSGTSPTTPIGGSGAGDTTTLWQGTINEILVYSVALTEAQRKQVEGYLAWKWGRQALLPASHSYRKFRP